MSEEHKKDLGKKTASRKTETEEPETVKKPKIDTPAAPCPKSTPPSFFVSNPVQSAAAYFDNPGFTDQGNESGSESEEEVSSLPPVSLFSANSGSGLFGSSLFGGNKQSILAGEKEKSGEKCSGSLFVPLTGTNKKASLFDPPKKTEDSKEGQPAVAENPDKSPSITRK